MNRKISKLLLLWALAAVASPLTRGQTAPGTRHDERSLRMHEGEDGPGAAGTHQPVVLPRSGHATFVDQPGMFLRAVNEFWGSEKIA